jgi:hypothetical protein
MIQLYQPEYIIIIRLQLCNNSIVRMTLTNYIIRLYQPVYIILIIIRLQLLIIRKKCMTIS